MSGYFELESAADLLKKAYADLARFDADPNPFDLWNAVVTANHICDWIVNDKSIPSKIRARARAKKADADVELLRGLANGLKHFERRTQTPTTSARRVGSSILGQARLGEAVLGSAGIQTYFVTDDQGTAQNASDVIHRALNVWERVIPLDTTAVPLRRPQMGR